MERPVNEHTMDYAPGCKERKGLNAELARMSNEVIDIPLIIDGKEVTTGNTGKVVMPHDHHHVLRQITKAEVGNVTRPTGHQNQIDRFLRARHRGR